MIPPQNFKQIEKNGTKIADLETNCRIKIQYEVLKYKYSQISQAKQNWASSQLDGNFKCLNIYPKMELATVFHINLIYQEQFW